MPIPHNKIRTFIICTGFVILYTNIKLSEEYSIYNEEDLMVVLEFKEDSPEEAKAAALELYIRFNKQLIAACISKLKYNGNDLGHAGEIIYNTWWRIKDKPQNYNPKIAQGKSPKEKVYRFFRGIMIIEYANWFNGRMLPEEEDYQIIYDLDDDSKFSNVKLKVLRQIIVESGNPLKGLSDAEKAIFFTYLEYRPEGKKIPRQVKAMLAEKFGLYGDDSVITYYHRARRKIQNYFKGSNG